MKLIAFIALQTAWICHGPIIAAALALHEMQVSKDDTDNFLLALGSLVVFCLSFLVSYVVVYPALVELEDVHINCMRL